MEYRTQKIIKTSEDYPQRLLELKNPPSELYVRGNVELLKNKCIATVGARQCTKYGETQAKRFSNYLSKMGYTIVSGLAIGIDTISHINSMENDGKTIAVMASGFDHIYPQENRVLVEKILENGGLVLSEYSDEVEPDMHRFPKRNKIIAGLSIATVLIESRYRSGSNITARETIKQKKEVFCVPGDINKIESFGPNSFIKNGANLVVSPYEIDEYFKNYDDIKVDDNSINPDYLDVYNCLGSVPISINEIVQKTKMEISKVIEVLFMLQTEDKIVELPGQFYKIGR